MHSSDIRNDGLETARRMASLLLRVGAVSINSSQPFVYTSGVTSPIYTDNRLLISYPEERQEMVDELTHLVADLVGVEGVDVVAGTATAGIPWAAWVAAGLRKPMVYVRPNPKEHGKAKQVEGLLSAGQRVVVVEDLVTTGTSSLQTIDAIIDAGGVVVACVALFTYEFDQARDAYAARAIPLAALATISTLLEVALAEGRIGPEDSRAVVEWLAPHRSAG